MTKKVFLNKLKSRFIVVLAVIFSVCALAFTLTACGKDNNNSTFTEPTYSKTETDTALVKNGSFEFGSSSLESDDYPQTSVTSWGIAVDNSAMSSTVNSGIVDTAHWDTLVSTLYEDSDYKTYLGKKLKEIDPDFVVSEKSKDEVLTFIKDNNVLPSPETPADTDGSKILMINNYGSSTRYGAGTAQKATMSDYITLEKGSYGKFTVWVKTVNLVGDGVECGANVRVLSTFNSSTQKEYSIYGIKVADWTKYEIYVKADKDFETKVKLALGLGYGNGASDMAEDYTEGTAYFDNVTFEVVEESALPATLPNETVFEYNGDKDVKVPASASEFTFNLSIVDSLENASSFTSYPVISDFISVNNAFASANHGFTESSLGVTSETILGSGQSSATFDGTTATLNNASYTITLDDPDFTLGQESYRIITFAYKNQLNRLNNTSISVFVEDYKGAVSKLTSALSITETNDEWKNAAIVVKNNFAEKDADGTYAAAKNLTFKLKIVIGPADITNLAKAKDFATGTVEFKDFTVFKGNTYQYERINYAYDAGNVTGYEETSDVRKDYKFYNLFSSLASTPVSLYAGYSKDYASTTDSYTFSVSPSDIGAIDSRPANVKSYTGITANHVYIKNGGVADVNTNKKAGLINTKFMNTYLGNGLAGIDTALNHTGDKDIQPLMIYNETEGSYGFVGNSITISASAYAKISVNVKVSGDAKAFIYLADLSGLDKGVMNFNVASNTDGYSYTAVGAEKSNKFAFEGITADMMDTTGSNKGWLTLSFYIATGEEQKTLRLEMWNGARDESVKSQGYVFFNSVSVSTSSAFSEPTSWENAFTSSDSILATAFQKDASIMDNYVLYKRVLDATETQFNAEQKDSAKLVSYSANIVWAKNSSTIYAVYNSIEPVAIDPYLANAETETEGSGCLAETDPSAFWMSFSSIALGVVLVLAIIALIVKRARAKRKANASDAKSHYNVTSRIKAQKAIAQKQKKEKIAKQYEEEVDEFEEIDKTEESNEAQEEVIENTEPEISEENENQTEPTLDEYVYGDVQDFGEEENKDNE